jgi:predicted dehydrogenase
MKQPLDRRDFLKRSAGAASLLAGSSLAPPVHARGSATLRVGLVGCGGRGTGAAANCVASAPGVELVAMGDLFDDRLKSSFETLEQELGAAFKVTPERAFTGFDAYAQVIASEVDLVLLATPPHFRPLHLQAAVHAKKHVFMEKPVATDPTGVRSVIASSRLAQEHGLAIVAGTQRRHQASYLELMRRIHDGAIGEIVAGQCWWNQGGLWVRQREADWSDMEWQVRNWLYFTWLSGDHICEQHIHNLDVMNWALGAHPLQATGMGGREVRTGPEYGNIYDHFSVEYEYPGGVLIQSSCRQIANTTGRVAERVVGTKGVADPSGSIQGAAAFRFDSDAHPCDPYVQEHTDLVASIRAGTPLNEGVQVAESTLTAIMGRMSTYTGKTVTWEQAMSSTLDLSPPEYAFVELPVEGVAVPGVTKLV